MSDYALTATEFPRARQHRSQVYRDTVDAFLSHPDLLAVRVSLDKKQDAAYSGLREALADLGVEDAVRVSRRGDTLWLVRTGE